MTAAIPAMTEPRRLSRSDAALGVAVVVMAALAAGAVWAMAALWFGRPLTLLALPLGAAVGIMARAQGFGGKASAALGCAALTLCASVYALALIASTTVAMAMGLNLLDTLRRIGPELALAVAWARTSPPDLVVFAIAALAAAAIAGWRSR